MNRHALTLVIVLLSAGCGSNKAPADEDVGIASAGDGDHGLCAASGLRRALSAALAEGRHRAPVDRVRACPSIRSRISPMPTG